jgi:hypothetical protein
MNHDEAHQQLMLEREREAIEALQRCLDAGASVDDIKKLASECGVDIRYLNLGEAYAQN